MLAHGRRCTMSQTNSKNLPEKSERHKLFGSVKPGKKTKPVIIIVIPGIQNTVDDFLFHLDTVGITKVKYPIHINSAIKPKSRTSVANFTFSTNIAQNSRGTNMSIFTEQLQAYQEQGFNTDFSTLKEFIVE